MPKTTFLYKRHLTGILPLLGICVLMLLTVNLTKAQSGRRTLPKPAIPPTETPAPEAIPKTTQSAAVKPEHSLKVVSNIPLTLYQEILKPERMHGWVVERLRSSPLLAVEFGPSANRSEAIKMAKLTSDTYVVLLELQENVFAKPKPGGTRASIGEVWINFYVLTPGTGKMKQTGKAILYSGLLTDRAKVFSKSRVCYPTLSSEEFYLLESSLEVAERVMVGFKVPIPPLECRQIRNGLEASNPR